MCMMMKDKCEKKVKPLTWDHLKRKCRRKELTDYRQTLLSIGKQMRYMVILKGAR